jgi:chromosome segregation ATPase
MEDKSVQSNPYHVALVATQEAYLGEVLGKFLDADAKLRIAYSQIKEFQQKLALHEQQAEQLGMAQEALNAMTSNKTAFEEQNTTLMDEVNAVRLELQEVKKQRQEAQEQVEKLQSREVAEIQRLKKERQAAMERELKAKEALTKLRTSAKKKTAVNNTR